MTTSRAHLIAFSVLLAFLPIGTFGQSSVAPLIFGDDFESGSVSEWGRLGPSACDKFSASAVSPEDIEALVDLAIEELETDTPWFEEYFWEIVGAVAEDLGCVVPTAAPFRRGTSNEDCLGGYCPNTNYCGPGDSNTSELTAQVGPPSDWVNRIW